MWPKTVTFSTEIVASPLRLHAPIIRRLSFMKMNNTQYERACQHGVIWYFSIIFLFSLLNTIGREFLLQDVNCIAETKWNNSVAHIGWRIFHHCQVYHYVISSMHKLMVVWQAVEWDAQTSEWKTAETAKQKATQKRRLTIGSSAAWQFARRFDFYINNNFDRPTDPTARD